MVSMYVLLCTFMMYYLVVSISLIHQSDYNFAFFWDQSPCGKRSIRSWLEFSARIPLPTTETTQQLEEKNYQPIGGCKLKRNCWRCKKTLPKAQRTRGLSSYHKFTNLDQITISESRLSVNLKISTKHQHQHQASESWPRFNFITSTKHQQ